MNADRVGPGRPSKLPMPVDVQAREDWLNVRLERTTPTFKAHAQALLSAWWKSSTTDVIRRAAAVEHLHAMIDELWRYREDSDTARQSLDRQEHRWRREREREEAGRKALIAGLDRVEQTIDRLDLEYTMGAEFDEQEWMSRLRAATSQAHAEHKEAWDDGGRSRS